MKNVVVYVLVHQKLLVLVFYVLATFETTQLSILLLQPLLPKKVYAGLQTVENQILFSCLHLSDKVKVDQSDSMAYWRLLLAVGLTQLLSRLDIMHLYGHNSKDHVE